MVLYKKILIYAVLAILALVFLAPIYGIITMSLKSLKELAFNYWGLPQQFEWQNFSYVWSRPTMGLKPYFINSFKIAIPSLIFIILFSLIAAYPLSKFKIKGQNILTAILIFGITVPHQILIVPIFKMLNAMHLYNTVYGLILVHVGYGIPFATFLFRNYMTQIPKEIIDSAMVDGASHPRTIFNIIIPLCKPVIAVAAILYFTWIFNEFFYGLILTNSINSTPATVAVSFLNTTNYAAYWNYQAAASLIISLPTLVVFLVFQRFFIKGIMLGSVKG
jgi:ABC-type glycerol-3-phosphate transport system permease component